MTEQEDTTTQDQHTDSAHEKQETVAIVLTADNHLGHDVFGQSRRAERQQRLRDAFQQAVTFAIGQKVDLFIQAGDLFDTSVPTEKDRSFVAARLAQLKQAGIRVIALGGLRDTPTKNSAPAPQVSYAQLDALHYLSPGDATENEEEEPLLFDIHGVSVGICGLGSTNEQVTGDPLPRLHVKDDVVQAKLSLLIAHVPIEGLSDADHTPAHTEIKQASIEQQRTFHYILAGCSQTYKQQRVGETEVIIAGATHSSDSATWSNAHVQQPGFVYMGLSSDGMQWCNHIVVDALRTQQLHIPVQDLWSDDTDTTPTERILERLEPLCDEETTVLLHLEGEITRRQFHQLDISRLRRYGEEHCFSLSIDDSKVSLVSNSDAIQVESSQRFSPRLELISVVEEWLADTHDESEKTALLNTKEELLAALDESRGKKA